MSRVVRVVDLGRQSYLPVLELQRRLVRARIEGGIQDDLLLLVQHDPVVTLGRGTRQTSLPLPEPVLRERGYEVVEVERGGDVTVHAPGQLVGYPIIDLQQHKPDLHWYLRQLEEAMIRGLADLGLKAERNPGKTGVWVSGRKIGSIGVHVKRWVTLHGFALNVTTDLRMFNVVVPCGIDGVVMTSVRNEAGGAVGAVEAVEAVDSTLWDRTRHAIIDGFGEAFAVEVTEGNLPDMKGVGVVDR
ncbi:MAG TPA: lipoyl(octanoyl) transferase LipB [Gemmatimonadales bacterium]|nr:lipoyl(octanoyl) transferase LipB [Gemmatimonadales bacterium]